MHDRIAPEKQRLLEDLLRLCAQLRRAFPGESVPCFAHLRVAPAGLADPGQGNRGSKYRDVFLGLRTLNDPAATVLHWQTAPLSAVFFNSGVGEEYELEVGGRVLEGTVLARSLLTFERGELVAVQSEGSLFTRQPQNPDAGFVEARAVPMLLQPRHAASRAVLPWSKVALDPEQQRAVELPAERPVLVQGEAGCGKTTVAVHRLAALCAAARSSGRRFRALLLVPAASQGLCHLSARLLQQLGVTEQEVEIAVFDRWAGRQARRVFPRLPERESQDAPAGVVAIKRHPALSAVLAAWTAQRGRRTGASRADLLHLFGDRALLEKIAAAAASIITAEAVREVLEHTRVQFCPTTEQASRHIDAERLLAIDGQRIDAGTPMHDAGSIDAEDYPVLFALAALRAGRGESAPGPTQYDCVVIDEAQEFAPIELALIGRAVRPGGSLIVAGDHAQQVDPSAYFEGFGAVMQALRAADFTTVQLAVSYRCPPEVTALARTLRDADLPAPVPAAGLPPEPASAVNHDAVLCTVQANECHLIARIIDALRELRQADSTATVAVICRSPAAAERMAKLLGRGLEARLARDGDFRFAAPVEVTCVKEVKGLEFDYVIVPDATSQSYPQDSPARRALYVAVTRTSQQLVLAAAGNWTPLLPARG